MKLVDIRIRPAYHFSTTKKLKRCVMKKHLFFISLLVFSCEGDVTFTSIQGSPPHFQDALEKTKKEKEPNTPALPSASDQSTSLATSRLSRREVENVVMEVFNIQGLALSRLPADVAEPFDTQQETNEASDVFVEGFESMAFEIAKRVSDDQTWILKYAACTPSDVQDRACIGDLARNIGEVLWRTHLSDSEISTLLDPAMALAKDANDIRYAIRFVIQGLLQSPRFIYRVQIGEEEENGLVRLTNEELITKLSFLILGNTPSLTELAKADAPPFFASRAKVDRRRNVKRPTRGKAHQNLPRNVVWL